MDRLTRILLIIISFLLFLNLIKGYLPPHPAYAGKTEVIEVNIARVGGKTIAWGGPIRVELKE